MRFFLFLNIVILTFHFYAQRGSIEYIQKEIDSQILDTIATTEEWLTTKELYPSGQVKIEERIWLSEGCFSDQSGAVCQCKYQKQIYYDNKSHGLMTKQGKYITQKKGIQKFNLYQWFYNDKAKLKSKIKSSSKEKMKF